MESLLQPESETPPERKKSMSSFLPAPSAVGNKRRATVTIHTPNFHPRLSVAKGGPVTNDKSKGRGKRDSIPDKSGAQDDSKFDAEQSQRKQVIFDETISKLQITEEELNAITVEGLDSDSRSSSVASKGLTRVAVRKEIPLDRRKPPTKDIRILRKAPPNAPVNMGDTRRRAGPRENLEGKVVPHSVLGSLNEFYRVALERGDVEEWEIPRDIRQEVVSLVRTTKAEQDGGTGRRGMMTPTTLDSGRQLPLTPRDIATSSSRPRSEAMDRIVHDADFGALKNWENKMRERRRVQGHISNLLQRPQDQMVMNSGEVYRAMQEERYIIDRTLGLHDKGKGFRIGSEFWKQQEILRAQENPEDELHLTLTKTEQGYPPSIEHVGVPPCSRVEKGVDWQPTKTPSYPWSFPFYKQRRAQLEAVIRELDPYTPEMDFLQVVGRSLTQHQPTFSARRFVENEEQKENQVSVDKMEVEDLDEKAEECPDNLAPVTSECETTVVGPSLLVGGCPVRWGGSTNSQSGTVGIEARVIFQSFTREKCVQHLDIINNGTTAIYYKWKRLPRSNPFELVQPHVKRFYFDIQGGVLMPKETLQFPFIFKCESPGIYTEQWYIETVPVLANGSMMLVTLRGIAQQEDFYAVTRAKLQADLSRQVAERMVLSILDELLHGIEESKRPSTPLDAYITEEELFLRMNPTLAYSMNNKKRLTQVYAECFPKEEREAVQWNSSIQDIREKILSMDDSVSAQAEDTSKKLYIAVNSMLSPIAKPSDNLSAELHHMSYHLLCANIEELFVAWSRIRQQMDLPELDVVIPDPRKSRSLRRTTGVSRSSTRILLTGSDARESVLAIGRPSPSLRSLDSRGTAVTSLKSGVAGESDKKKGSREGRTKSTNNSRSGGAQSPGKVSRSDTKLSAGKGGATGAAKPTSGGARPGNTPRDDTTGGLVSASGISQQPDDLTRSGVTDGDGGADPLLAFASETSPENQIMAREALCSQALHQMTYAWLYEFTGHLADLMVATEADYERRGIDTAPPSMSLFTL